MAKTNFIYIIIAMVMLNACNTPKQKRQEKIIPVKIMNITSQTVTDGRNYVGTVEESTAISLSFLQPGTVEEVFVKEGERVQKGQLLATQNNATAQNMFHAAQAQLDRAQDAYNRMTLLHDNGSLPDIKFEEVKTGLQQAKAQVAIARKNLEDCKLYAMRNGVIATRQVESGMNVVPGMQAFKLVAIEHVFIKISVPENEIGSTTEGQQAKVEVPALNHKAFFGKIELKGIAANAISHTYEVKIGIANSHAELMPDMVCKVWLKPQEETQAVLIPNRTVQISHDGRHYVWLAVGDKAEQRFVEIGDLGNWGVVVKSGLSEGDRLIVEGYQKVSEGSKINIEGQKR
jgi:RND family efflux transporter MFP subunit